MAKLLLIEDDLKIAASVRRGLEAERFVVETALNGGFAISLLLFLLIGKLLATSMCIGLGVPGGMIGPALFIGLIFIAAILH